MGYIFHPITFSLYVSLDLKWVSCRHNMYWSYFFSICSASVCFLAGTFTLFAFKVIIMCMFLLPFCSLFWFIFVGLCFPFHLLFFSLVIWWLSLVLCLDSFFFFCFTFFFGFYFLCSFHISLSLSLCVYIYIYIHTHIHKYIYTYVYTYTHIWLF